MLCLHAVVCRCRATSPLCIQLTSAVAFHTLDHEAAWQHQAPISGSFTMSTLIGANCTCTSFAHIIMHTFAHSAAVVCLSSRKFFRSRYSSTEGGVRLLHANCTCRYVKTGCIYNFCCLRSLNKPISTCTSTVVVMCALHLL